MIGITGATGQLGSLVMRFLAERVSAAELVALARDQDKAAPLARSGVSVREADYERPDTLAKALEGVERLLLIASNSNDRRTPQHRAVIDAAGRAGVGRIVYTSLLHTDESSMVLARMHRETEALLQACDVDYVIARNGWYIENLFPRIRTALASGSLKGCAGEGRISCAGRVDYAAGAATILLADEIIPGTIVEMAGTQSFSLGELATEISRQTGVAVSYDNLSYQDYKAALIGDSMTPAVADLLANCDEGTAKGYLQATAPQLDHVIGRPCITLAKAVGTALSG